MALGFDWSLLGVCTAGGFGIRRSRGRGIFFGRLFVLIAAIIGDVKAAALENQTGATGYGTFYFTFAPALLGTDFFRARRQWFGGDGLELFKLVSAFLTNVNVSRHKAKL